RHIFKKTDPDAAYTDSKRKNSFSTTSARSPYLCVKSGPLAYMTFQSLHALWVSFMQELRDLGGSAARVGCLLTSSSHGAKLVSAHYHGAEVEVVRSRSSGRVGLKGIVVRDAKFTFIIFMVKGEVKTEWLIEHTVLKFTVPLPVPTIEESVPEKANIEETPNMSIKLVIQLYGSQFANRPVDRANKKFK
ncbi:hypothetical protein N7520_005848, partial [Penicillium odoratum]|uniref:uncharacterized protein n=1 Tax=Penicillium odoratum TaxID=1167516 RepID=UPI00254747BF